MSFFTGFFFATTIILGNVLVIKHYLNKDK